MNLEDIKTLRDLHELVKIGMITEGDFNIKKNEIINSQKPVSSDDRINLIRELHFLLQENIISEDDFNLKKQQLLNSQTISSGMSAVEMVQEHTSSSNTESNAQSANFNSVGNDSEAVMETILHQLNVDGLNMKITNDKLFVNSAISNETFALRSVNGVGIVDMVERFNQDLKDYKAKKITSYFILFIALPGLWLVFADIIVGFGILLIIVGIGGYFLMRSSYPIPTLKSAVRIMLHGTSRDFEFDKKSPKAPEVAKFVALVEDTFTAYQKNN